MDKNGIITEDKSLVESIASDNLRKILNETDCAATREQASSIRII
jgi:hypothetical protein